MIASRGSGSPVRPTRPVWRVPAALAAAMLLLPLAAVAAETGGAARTVGPPLQLVPAWPGSPAAPLPAVPAAATPRPELLPPLQQQPAAPPGTPAGQPPPPAAGGIGQPDRAGNLFGPALWQGATAGEVQALLALLPVGAPSWAMRDLMRRLLLAPAPLPQGTAAGPGLAVLRARKLAELGLTAELLALAAADAAAFAADEAARAPVDALLLDDRRDEACARAAAQGTAFVPPAADPPYWTQMLVLCRIIAGRRAEAERELDLLHERGGGDPVFRALALGVIQRRDPALPDGAWRTLADPDALLLALLRSANRPVATAALRVTDPARLRAIAESPPTPAVVRLDAAERAAAAGALSPARLAELYATLPLAAGRSETAPGLTARDGGPRRRAQLVQAAARAGSAEQAMMLHLQALALARTERMPLAVVLALLAAAPPVEVHRALAVEAAAARYAAADLEPARAWLALLRSGAPGEAGAADRAALARLWPLRLLAGDVPGDAAAFHRGFDAWVGAIRTAGGETGQGGAGQGEAGQGEAAMVLTVLDALGRPVGPAAWRHLAVEGGRNTAALPAAALLWRLPAAAERGEFGLTVLLALAALGEHGPAGAPPALLAPVLAALARVGLEAEAQRLGAEAIWAARR